MGGNTSGAGGLSNLFGGGNQSSFDPTTGSPIYDPTGSSAGYWGGPTNPQVTEQAPQQAAQNTQAGSYDPTTGQPTASPTGQQSGSPGQSLMQNLSSIFLGSGAQQAGLTGGATAPAPAPPNQGYAGWPTEQQLPGSAAANTFGGGPQPTTVNPWTETGLGFTQQGASPLGRDAATVSPQSAPVSGKTQAEIPPVEPAPAPEAAAPAAATADTTNYPDVSGTSRESGMGPGGEGAYNNPAFSTPQGGGIPPVLQDLFSLNFGRFIADLLGQQGMPANQNQAAAPPPSADTGAATSDTGDTGTATPDKGDQGQKTAQGPIQKAAGAAKTAADAIKPQKSPVDATGTPAAAAPAAPGAPAVPTAPQTPAATPGATASIGNPMGDLGGTGGLPASMRAPGTPAPSALANLFGIPGSPTAAAARPPAAAPTGAPGEAAAPPPGGSDFAAWRDFQLRNSDPETRRMYLENQARPEPGAPAGAAGGTPGNPPVGATAAPGQRISSLGQPPGGQPTANGGREPTNGMPGGLTPNAPPPIAGYGASEDQSGRRIRQGGKTNHYEGKITFDPSLGVDATQFRFGTGGGQFASLPYGTYMIHMGATGGPNGVGRAIGAWAGLSDSNNPNNNTVHDPMYRGSSGARTAAGFARDGVEIHPDVSGRQLITNGCIGIDRGQSALFGRTLKAAAAKGDLAITVRPDGSATIFRANNPTTVLGNSQSNQYDFDKRVAANRSELVGRLNPFRGGPPASAAERRIRREQNQPGP